MNHEPPSWTRLVRRGLLWLFLGLLGLVVAVVVGPVSPEAAAWLGSRQRS